MTDSDRIEKLERQQQMLIACVMTLAGPVMEYAARDLGGPGPSGLSGDEIASKGLQMLGKAGPCKTGGEAVERAVRVLRLLRDEEPEFERWDRPEPARPDNAPVEAPTDETAKTVTIGASARRLLIHGTGMAGLDMDTGEIVLSRDGGEYYPIGFGGMATINMRETIAAWEPFVKRTFRLLEDPDGGKKLEDYIMTALNIPEEYRP